jgi:Predicted flavoprotein involved in K+ transport
MNKEVDVLIVGSGFGGLGLGAKLKQNNHPSFVIIERANDVGGAWRDNTYPGVECDVPSHLYSFSWKMNPNWSKTFAPGDEILNYMRDCAKDENLLENIDFNTEMLTSTWNSKDKLWHIETTQGLYIARYLVTAAGHLADEHLPNIEGLKDFKGDCFHSARWNNDADLTNKRVAIVGSGASAIQIVPEISKIAKEVVVFQRSAAYVVPRPDSIYTEQQKRLFKRMPSEMNKLRQDIFWAGEYNFIQRRNVPKFVNEAKKQH